MENSIRNRFLFFFIVIISFVFSVIFVSKRIYTFLSLNQPNDAQIMAIEGWLPDYALEIASKEIEKGMYNLIITLGPPIKTGQFLIEYKDFANLSRLTLEKITGRKDIIPISVPAIEKNRTFQSALALKNWLKNNSVPYKSINLVTLDVHARRSLYLFKKALGKDYRIGVIAIDDIYYDGNRWWASSYGVEKIITETIAFIYSKIFFNSSGEFAN